MTPFEARRGPYRVSTDQARLDLDVVHAFLVRSYWAGGVPREVVERAVRHSLSFGLYERDQQVGFCRVITDHATFAYLADVFVLESHRGRGLSKWLMECVRAHPAVQGLRRWLLVTRDAHELYRRFGFGPVQNPPGWMEIYDPEVYGVPAEVAADAV